MTRLIKDGIPYEFQCPECGSRAGVQEVVPALEIYQYTELVVNSGVLKEPESDGCTTEIDEAAGYTYNCEHCGCPVENCDTMEQVAACESLWVAVTKKEHVVKFVKYPESSTCRMGLLPAEIKKEHVLKALGFDPFYSENPDGEFEWVFTFDGVLLTIYRYKKDPVLHVGEKITENNVALLPELIKFIMEKGGVTNETR